MSDQRDVHDERAKRKAVADIEQFRTLVKEADVEFVGRDESYVPDAPRLREQFENHTEIDG